MLFIYSHKINKLNKIHLLQLYVAYLCAQCTNMQGAHVVLYTIIKTSACHQYISQYCSQYRCKQYTQTVSTHL